MKEASALDAFAGEVLATYHAGEEEFWAAVMAPFLSDATVMSLWKYRKIGLELMTLFKAVDGDRKKLLAEYSLPHGFDITKWKSLNAKDEYFRDAYPIYAFLAIWMEKQGLTDNLTRFGDILRAVVHGIAGYGILDVIVDRTDFSAVELLTAQALIAEYETTILRAFGVSETNLDVLHRTRAQFLKAEIREKSLRGKSSPYTLDKPLECGFKAAHLLTPFMLSLDRLGKASLIEAYFQVFFSFGAVIQILDDLKDLEDDLAIGHFSYVTLGSDAVPLLMKGRKPGEVARKLLADTEHLKRLFDVCKQLIADSNAILEDLHDPFLARIVSVTELRLDAFFRKELRLGGKNATSAALPPEPGGVTTKS